MSDIFDPEDGVRISKALIKAIGEAQVLVGAGDVGPQFRDIVQHARELYDLLLEQLFIAEDHAIPHLHGMSEAMGNRLFELEALLEDRPDPTQLN